MKTSKAYLSSVSLLVAGLWLAGCVAPNTMLVNPNNGEMQSCSASGWGWAGAPMAQISHNRCVDGMKSAGFIPLEDVKPGRIRITSYPNGADLYAGPERDKLEWLAHTPYEAIHPNNSRMWGRGCYQVKKDGFVDSEVKCRNAKWGDRIIPFRLHEEE